MIPITPEQLTTLCEWFVPERPGPLVASHIMQTGNGVCLVDRWLQPRAVLVETAGNYSLSGDASVLSAEELRHHVAGFVEATEPFVPLLQAAFPDLKIWQRLIYAQPEPPAGSEPAMDGSVVIRRLEPSDSELVQNLSDDVRWISSPWGGAEGLCASGVGWGEFVAERLASVACPFFLGYCYEDIGVVTEAEFRGLGLSPACVRQVCRDIWSRGHRSSWTTSPDNVGSVRVAEKLGFVLQRRDVLYAAGVEIPPAPQPPSG